MKAHLLKCILSLSVPLGIILSSFTTTKEQVYKVDVTRSILNWTGYYVFSFSEHNGTIGLSGGEIKAINQQIVSGFFDIDMKSIKNLDIPDGANKDLENHLMSDDFFSVDKFQTARFEITKTEKIKDAIPGGPNYDVTGEFTLKGVKNSLTFPAFISFSENGIEAKAKFKFDRTRWNVRYNSGKFFFDIGDGAISDAIGMEIHLFTSKN
jgi:polyisoprenoid-binding protein YceI